MSWGYGTDWQDDEGYLGDYDAPDDDSWLECPRCGMSVDRLVGVTGRGGTRYVCETCRSDALRSDRSFWHWYWKE
jgi:hypothetical protein